jgi:hypothetical protein
MLVLFNFDLSQNNAGRPLSYRIGIYVVFIKYCRNRAKVSARIFRLDRKINSWKTLLTHSPSVFPHVITVSAEWINRKVMASYI